MTSFRTISLQMATLLHVRGYLNFPLTFIYLNTWSAQQPYDERSEEADEFYFWKSMTCFLLLAASLRIHWHWTTLEFTNGASPHWPRLFLHSPSRLKLDQEWKVAHCWIVFASFQHIVKPDLKCLNFRFPMQDQMQICNVNILRLDYC